MKFTTESGSAYELDVEGRRIRRVSGEGAPTPRTGEDGVWKEFAFLQPETPQVGEPVLIAWAVHRTCRDAGFAVPATFTSPVTHVEQL